MPDKFIFPFPEWLEEEIQQKTSYLKYMKNRTFHCKLCNRTYLLRYYRQHQKIKVHKNTT